MMTVSPTKTIVTQRELKDSSRLNKIKKKIPLNKFSTNSKK